MKYSSHKFILLFVLVDWVTGMIASEMNKFYNKVVNDFISSLGKNESLVREL